MTRAHAKPKRPAPAPSTEWFAFRFVEDADPKLTWLCRCGNDARYYVDDEKQPRYCGICDIVHNGGRGKRTDERSPR